MVGRPMSRSQRIWLDGGISSQTKTRTCQCSRSKPTVTCVRRQSFALHWRGHAYLAGGVLQMRERKWWICSRGCQKVARQLSRWCLHPASIWYNRYNIGYIWLHNVTYCFILVLNVPKTLSDSMFPLSRQWFGEMMPGTFMAHVCWHARDWMLLAIAVICAPRRHPIWCVDVILA